MLRIFNYSVKKLSNLEWSFSMIDSSWKNKTPTISNETFRMVINLSKHFLQTQILFVFGKAGSRERKLLNFKRSSKTLLTIQKLYQITYIFCNTLSSLIPTDWHQQKPLDCSEFAEPNYLLKRSAYIVAYLGFMLQASWHILECN